MHRLFSKNHDLLIKTQDDANQRNDANRLRLI